MHPPTEHPANPLDAAYRSVRRLAPPESPFGGMLARDGDQAVVLVDVGALGEWAGWRAQGPHVLSPFDLARREGGHDAVLPWCVERVEDFAARRCEGGVEITRGEAVTIAASIVRGTGALTATRGCVPPEGEWWITDEGRPIYVPLLQGGDAPAAASAGALAATARACSDRDAAHVLELAARSAASAPEAMVDLEHAVFALAPPEPLALAPLTPRRASGIAPADRAPIEDAASSGRGRPGRLSAIIRGALHRHMDDGIADLVSDAAEQGRRRGLGMLGAVKRPWLVALLAGTAILAGGLTWPAAARPAASPASSSAERSAPSPAPSDAMSTATSTAPEGGHAATEAPQDALAMLLEYRGRCAVETQPRCASAVFENPATGEIAPGPIDLSAADREIVLLDDLGGVAVLRVDALSDADPAASQLVVIVETPAGWLIRDVRDMGKAG